MVIAQLISARFYSGLPANRCGVRSCKVVLGILLSCIFPLFSGCQLLPVQTQPEAAITTVQTEPVAGAHNAVAADFNILGRIAIQDDNQSFTGSFRWQHLAASDEILLFTPLGQAVAEIYKDHEGVRLITSKMEAFYADNVESLTEEILGWRLPLNGLQFWIQGLHSPANAAQKDFDNKNQLVAIRQDGWHIHYQDFAAAQPNTAPLPRVLNLMYQKLKIRLVVDDWKVQ
ncbi:MAG: outer membrane lipoprotein LolB [Proteobacteria bacterium]|nr:outer membrane lipoprotein LolB [Pseudomonadota bacterium]